MKPLIESQIAEGANLFYKYIEIRQKEIDNSFELYNYIKLLDMKTHYMYALYMYVSFGKE